LEQEQTVYRFRAIEPDDAAILKEFLYMAIFVPPDQPPPPRELLEHPDVKRYVSGWGREHDRGLLAIEQSSRTVIGAAWVRIWPEGEHGFGYVNDLTPELTIAVQEEHRGKGVGTELMQRLLNIAAQHHKAVSLSVDKINTLAFKLYLRLGFRIVEENKDDFIMLWTPKNKT
jgi:ribosomal protein S18 acetylase RimI-like enzyme